MSQKWIISCLGLATVTICIVVIVSVRSDGLQVPYVQPDLPEDVHPRFVAYIEGFQPRVVDPSSILPVEAQRKMAYVRNVVSVRPHWVEADIEELLEIIADHESFRDGLIEGEPLDTETRASWGVLSSVFSAFMSRILNRGHMSDAAEARLIQAMLGYATHHDVYFRSNGIMILTLSPRILRTPEVRRVVRDAYHNDPSPRITSQIDQRMRFLRSRGSWEGEL